MRMRRVLLASLAVVALSTVLAGCAGASTAHDAAGTSHPRPVATAQTVVVPKPMYGEIARVVVKPKPNHSVHSTTEAESKPNQSYFVYAACQAQNPGHTVTWEVRVDDKLSTSGKVACDGVTTGGAVPAVTAASSYQVQFTGAPKDMVTGYAVIVPLSH